MSSQDQQNRNYTLFEQLSFRYAVDTSPVDFDINSENKDNWWRNTRKKFFLRKLSYQDGFRDGINYAQEIATRNSDEKTASALLKIIKENP